jgi:hypothetical protein
VKHPAEFFQATIGTIIGAVLIIAGAFFDVSKFTPQVTGAIVLLLSYIAAAVTFFVVRNSKPTPGA